VCNCNCNIRVLFYFTVSSQSEADSASDVQTNPTVSSANRAFVVGVKDIPSALKSLLCNATFMALNMAGACESTRCKILGELTLRLIN